MTLRTVHVKASIEYDVHIGRGLLDKAGEYIGAFTKPCTAVLVMDDTVAGIYGERVKTSLKNAGFSTLEFVFPNGEDSKSLSTLSQLVEFMAAQKVTRSDIVVAFGGGVTGDLAGFAAAVYLRGIRCVQLPTTLLAAVDSSVGGKTAVNLGAGKNLCGAFHQPSLVICDCDTFETLPPETFAAGMAEAVKYGVLTDGALFEKFETVPNKGELEDIVARCIAHKRDIVEEDEHDTGLRQLLNLGHTPAHAIEALSDFGVAHGHAVAIGMVMMARASEKLGFAKEEMSKRLLQVLKLHALPTETEFGAKEMAQAALSDKKRQGGTITLVMPVKIGETVLHKIPVEELERYFEAGKE